MIADPSFRTARNYMQMTERELSEEAELKLEQADLDARTDDARDLRVEDRFAMERASHLKRAEVYARLAQALATLKPEL